VIVRGLQLVSALSMIPVVVRAQEASSCVHHDSESLRESLNYTDSAPTAEQSCKACGFFSEPSGSCGSCAIMSGPVDANGHCDSWSAKE
jgi:hypothetical protein